MNVKSFTCTDATKERKVFRYTIHITKQDKSTYTIFRKYTEIFDLWEKISDQENEKKKLSKKFNDIKQTQKSSLFRKQEAAEKRCRAVVDFFDGVMGLPSKDYVEDFLDQRREDRSILEKLKKEEAVAKDKKSSKKEKESKDKHKKDAEKLAEAASKQATCRQNSADHHRAGEAQRSSIGKCKVIAPYTATAKGQLTVKVNDMVDVQENSNSGWCFVEFDDKEGVIPSCCLDIKSISGNDIEHVSLMRATPGKFLTNVKYKGAKEDEMSYPKGAEVDVIDTKTNSPGYWLIKYKGKTGITPMVNLTPKSTSRRRAKNIKSIYDSIPPRTDLQIAEPYCVVDLQSGGCPIVGESLEDDVEPYSTTVQLQPLIGKVPDVCSDLGPNNSNRAVSTDMNEYSEIRRIPGAHKRPQTPTSGLQTRSSVPPAVPEKSEGFISHYGAMANKQQDEIEPEYAEVDPEVIQMIENESYDATDDVSVCDNGIVPEDDPEDPTFAVYENCIPIMKKDASRGQAKNQVATQDDPINYYNILIEAVSYSNEVTDCLKDSAWYAGKINRTQIETYMKKYAETGQYCVRLKTAKANASNVSMFALTVAGENRIRHFEIEFNPEIKSYTFGIECKKQFNSIKDIVKHYTYSGGLGLGTNNNGRLKNAFNIKEIIENECSKATSVPK